MPPSDATVDTSTLDGDTFAQIEQHIQADEIEREAHISNSARLVSATAGALITSVVVTPFDVVKTRLQAQFNLKAATVNGVNSSTGGSALRSISSRLPRNVVSTWCDTCLVFAPYQHAMHHLTPLGAGHCAIELGHIHRPHAHYNAVSHTVADICPSDRTIFSGRNNAAAVESQPHFTGSMDAVKQLVRNEGVGSLWRGLTATLAMSVPSTVVYYSMYDKLKLVYHQYLAEHDATLVRLNSTQYNHQHSIQLSSLSPLLAGTSARTLTTVLVSPVELIRTRTQATSNKSVTAASIIRQELSQGGVRALWRGLYPTLWRDVPFSAVYWSVYESLKFRLFTHWQHSHPSHAHEHHTAMHRQDIVTAAFISGATSGMIAATMTHPFDLVKTRRQIDMYQGQQTAPVTTFSIMKTIVQTEGVAALWSGLTPRVLKIAPACSIMIASYEFAKTYLSTREQQQQQQITQAEPV